MNNSDEIFSNFLIGKNKWLHNSSKNLEFWWKSKQQHIQTEFWSKCLRNSKIIWCIYHYSFLSVFWSKLLKNSTVSYSKDYYIDGQNIQLIFFQKLPLREGKWPPKLHPGGGFFGPWSFITLKNSHQDLSNERSNFTKEFLEVGHWALKQSHFLTNYLKLQILAS